MTNISRRNTPQMDHKPTGRETLDEVMLRYLKKRELTIPCEICKEDLVICIGDVVRPYLRHKPGSVCSGGGRETIEHLLAKRLLVEHLNKGNTIVFRTKCCKMISADTSKFNVHKWKEEVTIKCEGERNKLDVAGMTPRDKHTKKKSVVLCIEVCNTNPTSEGTLRDNLDCWVEVDAEEVLRKVEAKHNIKLTNIRECKDCSSEDTSEDSDYMTTCGSCKHRMRSYMLVGYHLDSFGEMIWKCEDCFNKEDKKPEDAKMSNNNTKILKKMSRCGICNDSTPIEILEHSYGTCINCEIQEINKDEGRKRNGMRLCTTCDLHRIFPKAPAHIRECMMCEAMKKLSICSSKGYYDEYNEEMSKCRLCNGITPVWILESHNDICIGCDTEDYSRSQKGMRLCESCNLHKIFPRAPPRCDICLTCEKKNVASGNESKCMKCKKGTGTIWKKYCYSCYKKR